MWDPNMKMNNYNSIDLQWFFLAINIKLYSRFNQE